MTSFFVGISRIGAIFFPISLVGVSMSSLAMKRTSYLTFLIPKMALPCGGGGGGGVYPRQQSLNLSPFPRCRQLSPGALTFPRLHPLRPLAHSPADRALPTTHASTALSGPCATSSQFYKNSIQYPRIAGDQKASTSTSTSCIPAAGGGRRDKHPIAGDPRDDFMAGDSKGLSVIEDGQWGRWKVEAGVGAEEGKRHKRALLVPSTGIDAGSEVGGRVPRANAEGAVVVDVDAGEGGADDDFWRVVHVLWLERHLHGGRSPLGKGAAGVTHRNGRLEPGGSDSGECRRHGEAVDGNRHEERNGRQGRSLREHFSSAAEQSLGRVNPKLPALLEPCTSEPRLDHTDDIIVLPMVRIW